MIEYRDFVTKKIRKSRGKPIKVVRGGPLGCLALVVENSKSWMWIPEYLLIGKGREVFEEIKRKEGYE